MLKSGNINSSPSKKRGIKQGGAVNRRIGRLQQKYPSISKLYTIALKADETGTVTDIACERSESAKAYGVYFIRCSQKQLTDELTGEIYNILHEIESTFRCLKTDLDIRPIYHQKARIYRTLNFKQTNPKMRRKAVVPHE